MRTRGLFLFVCLLAMLAGLTPTVSAGELDRTELPIKPPTHPPITELDARDADEAPEVQGHASGRSPERRHRADR